MNRPISFTQACDQYPHRFTMEHVPAWARKPHLHESGEHVGKTLFYAPQYRTDREWYENTIFPGEGDISSRADYCESSGATWPLGHWLEHMYAKR